MRINLSDIDVEAVRAGEPVAVKLCIERIYPLIKKVTDIWASKFPQKADDIRSIGNYALVLAVNRCKHSNIVGYAKWYVEGYIRNFLKSDHQVRTPRWIQDENRKLNPDYQLPETVSMNGDDYVETSAVKGHENDLLGFYEFCLSRMSLNSLESRILALARDGYTDAEIASQVGKSNSMVNVIRRELKTRFFMLRNNPKVRAIYFGDV